MNAVALPVIPGGSFPPAPFSLRRILTGLVLTVAAFDICFWGAEGVGLSLAVFVPIVSLAILVNRSTTRVRRSPVVIGVLLAGACWATMVDVGPANIFMLLVLMLALAGDTYFDGVGTPWARWFTQAVAMLRAPGRLFWLLARIWDSRGAGGGGLYPRIFANLFLAIPALVLAAVFGVLLASGNAVFGIWAENFLQWFWTSFFQLFNLERTLAWLVVALLALPLLRPAGLAPSRWEWLARLPRLPELIAPRGASFSSALILIVLNGLFLVANGADAIFLWRQHSLPAGVTYSAYVHGGVNTLTATMLLSVVVLVGIFQQDILVARRRGLKVLGMAWVAQN